MATETTPLTATKVPIAAPLDAFGAQHSRAGVGYSEQPHSREAGAEAARRALAQASLTQCDLVLLFGTGKHDPHQLHEGVRLVVGPAPRIFGGYSDGIITNDRLGYDGLQVGVAVISSPTLQIDLLVEPGLPDREYEVGLALGQRLNALTFRDEPNLLLMYDTVKEGVTAGGVSLNMSTPLLAGMTEALGTWPRTAGAGLVGTMAWTPTFQWYDDQIVQQSAMALVLSGGVRMDTIVMHGCRPSTGYYTITRADANTVLELDNRPAVQVLDELTGVDAEWKEWPLALVFGVNNGDPFGDFVEDDYAIRLCMALDEARGGLVMFGDDLQEGVRVQLMRKSLEPEYMHRRIAQVMELVGQRRQILALYIDCAGRQGRMCRSDREEAIEVQQALGDSVPLLGFYTGGEIARSGSVMQSHYYTGVLCLFSEER
jgi:hypothetical protein